VTPVIARVHTDEGFVGIGETFIEDPSSEKSRWVGQSIRGLSKHLFGQDPRRVKDR
jgi:L-alanine-DL-glutamate epimerase-like enolase superfamily enzyme